MIENKNKVGRKPKPTVKIGIDCGSLNNSNLKNASGIATVCTNLLHELSVIDKRNFYYLFSLNKLDQQIIDRFDGRAQNLTIWPSFGFKRFRLPLALKITKPDVFLALSQSIPSHSPPALGFIYDVSFIKNSTHYKNARILKNQTDFIVKSAKHIITLSKTSKDEIVSVYPQTSNKISVVYPGVSSVFTHEASKYVDNLPYFLYVGQLKSSKNIPFLITAFAKFLEESDLKYKLVLIGSLENADKQISKTINKYKIKEYVDIPGAVNQEELAKYYRGAQAFVSPAFFEGFGLPLIEAMSCGTAVITSNKSAMPEIAGDSAILIDPYDINSLVTALNTIAKDTHKREFLIKSGLKRVNLFSWKLFAKEILDKAYKIAAGEC